MSLKYPKISQWEIVLRYLNNANDWVPAYNLRGVNTNYGWLGNQGDRRARDLVLENGDKQTFEYIGEYDGIKYFINGRTIKRCRQYYAKILQDRGKFPCRNYKKDYNAELEELKKSIKWNWDNAGLLNELNKVIKSTNEYAKRSMIDKLKTL